jgi:hypothetical protein
MFIGHFAVGFAAKRFAPRTSLGLLITAPIFLDLLWPVFVLLGWEQVRIDPGNTALTPLDFISYPYSHSLLMAVVWATLFAGVYLFFSRYTAGSVAIWIGVVSHWFLDVIVHRADMPLYPNGPKFGFGLWNSPAATVVLEGFIYCVGVFVYSRVTRANNRIGKWGFWLFVLVLVAFYVADLFSPPPQSITPLAIAALVFSGLLILWAWWFDRHRTVN